MQDLCLKLNSKKKGFGGATPRNPTVVKAGFGISHRAKRSKIVKTCQKYFRHFSTIFARHQFSGPFWGSLKRTWAISMSALACSFRRASTWNCRFGGVPRISLLVGIPVFFIRNTGFLGIFRHFPGEDFWSGPQKMHKHKEFQQKPPTQTPPPPGSP